MVVYTQEVLQHWEDTIAVGLGAHPSLDPEMYRIFSNVIFRGGKRGRGSQTASFPERLIPWRLRKVDNESEGKSKADVDFGVLEHLYHQIQ